MGTTIINQTGSNVTSLDRSLGMPSEGPKLIPLLLDFTATDTYILDYQNKQALGYVRLIQSVYVDNSDSTVALIIKVPNSQQRLIVPAQSQGYFPLLVPNPILIKFTCHGGPATTTVQLLNFPVQPGTWKVV